MADPVIMYALGSAAGLFLPPSVTRSRAPLWKYAALCCAIAGSEMSKETRNPVVIVLIVPPLSWFSDLLAQARP
jgi:hypothetical protein